MSTSKTIVLKGEMTKRIEAKAGGSVTPGHLIAYNSSDALVVHPTAKAKAETSDAIEDDLQGKGIDDVYAQDALVQGIILEKGDEANMILAISQTIVIGDLLESAGAGQLRKQTAFAQAGASTYAVTTEGHSLFVAREAVTTTSAVKRIAVAAL